MTVSGHGLVGPTSLTATGATYTASTGVLVVTSNGHGLENGDKVQLEDNSLTFTCSMDGDKTEHTYPRSSDQASTGWLTVANKQTNTFEINVGKSPLIVYNPTSATYDGTTGYLKMQIGDHILTPKTNIRMAKESLSFKCSMDGLQSTKKYPRSTDPIYDKSIPILFDGELYTATGASYVPTSGKMTITCSRGLTPTDISYVATAGVMKVTVPNHGLSNGDNVRIADNALTFTCGMDNHYSEHSYPRSTDPKSGLAIAVSGVTPNTFTIDVGTSPIVALTPNSGSYDPTTGMMTLGFPTNHNLSVGTSIRLKKESLKFSCAFGGASGDAAIKSYPRTTDPFYNTSLLIESVTNTTITVQVLTTVPSTNTDAHTFVSADTGAVTTGGDYVHKFVRAVTNGITTPKHGFANKDRIKIADGSLVFDCALDGNSTEHSYPRSTDPYSGRWLSISGVTDLTFDVNVGISPDTSLHTFKSAAPNGIIKRDGSITLDIGKSPQIGYDISTATYDAATGDMVLTIAGSHNLTTAGAIQIADDGLSFTCTMDGNATTHSYPRLTDPARKNALKIKAVSTSNLTAAAGTTYNPTTGVLSITSNGHGLTAATTKSVTDAQYNPGNGNLILTSAAHGFVNGDRVKIADNSLTFTCGKDNHASTHTYPRSTDPSSNAWLFVQNVSTNKFTVNIGKSQDLSAHRFISATASNISKAEDAVKFLSLIHISEPTRPY